MPKLVGETNQANVSAVQGTHTGAGDGVQGVSNEFNHSGVAGRNDIGVGVLGISAGNDGVRGFSEHRDRHGVVGTNTAGGGVLGQSTQGSGVNGTSSQGAGVFGRGPTGGRFEGGSVAAVHAVAVATGPAIVADGDVQVLGDISLTGGDCAEDFDVSGNEEIDPGTVVVIDEEGAVTRSLQAYDKRVAGVVSGAGGFKPGIILDKGESNEGRLPVALIGKVACKVDARYSPIGVGDLLTTSTTPGYAMKADDPLRAFGAVIGKALRSLKGGHGIIPVLIALQ